jgi:hypothetical protein
LVTNVVDLAPHFAADITGDEIIHLVDAGKRPNRRRGQVNVRMDEKLLRQFDDGTICAAHVLASAACCAGTRDYIDNEVDLIGQKGIEIDERRGRQLRQFDVSGKTRMIGKSTAVLGEDLTLDLLRLGIFRQHTLARDLGDVGGLEVHLQRQAIHQACQLDALVIEATDEFRELFLRRHHDLQFAVAQTAEILHYALQVEHLLHIAGDKLADLVHHEDEVFT